MSLLYTIDRIMSQEPSNGPEATAEKARENPHEELLKASEDLAKLADWCEEKYLCETSREEVKFVPGTYRLYGGRALKTTGQFAVQVGSIACRQGDTTLLP